MSCGREAAEREAALCALELERSLQLADDTAAEHALMEAQQAVMESNVKPL